MAVILDNTDLNKNQHIMLPYIIMEIDMLNNYL